MNTLAVPGLGDTIKFRDKVTTQATTLGMSSNSQMPKLNFSISSPYSNQSSDHLFIFLSK